MISVRNRHRLTAQMMPSATLRNGDTMSPLSLRLSLLLLLLPPIGLTSGPWFGDSTTWMLKMTCRSEK